MSGIRDVSEGLGLLMLSHQQNQAMHDELIKRGWFYYSGMIWKIKKETETIDEYMERCILENYDRIKEGYCYEPYPHRKIILEEAFKLFEEERYIACIPLFLSQIDGISQDAKTAGFFSGKNQLSKNTPLSEKRFTYSVGDQVSEGESKDILNYFYSKFLAENSENLHISQKTTFIAIKARPKDIDYLNRHGIMHGHIDYLEYGTRLNALKVITALLFVINIDYELKTQK